MVINLDRALELALQDSAQKQGVAPEVLAVKVLRQSFLPALLLEPRDEWERGLRAAASDCGVALSNEAVSSEGLYD